MKDIKYHKRCTILDSFANFFGDYLFFAVIILAFIPCLESRVALPFALSFGLSPFVAFLCAFVGSIIPIYPILIATRKVKNRFFTGFVTQRYSQKLGKISSQTHTIKKLILLCGFVAIPLPMTGVWSGSVIGGMTQLKFWQSFVSISIGSLVSCAIILAVCLIFKGSELVVLYISLILLAIFACYELVSFAYKRKRSKS